MLVLGALLRRERARPGWSFTPKRIHPGPEDPKLEPITPGWSELVVTPRPASLRPSSALHAMLASFEAP